MSIFVAVHVLESCFFVSILDTYFPHLFHCVFLFESADGVFCECIFFCGILLQRRCICFLVEVVPALL